MCRIQAQEPITNRWSLWDTCAIRTKTGWSIRLSNTETLQWRLSWRNLRFPPRNSTQTVTLEEARTPWDPVCTTLHSVRLERGQEREILQPQKLLAKSFSLKRVTCLGRGVTTPPKQWRTKRVSTRRATWLCSPQKCPIAKIQRSKTINPVQAPTTT